MEADLVGGDCSHWACIPSKALLRPPEALRTAQRVDGARQAVGDTVNAEAVQRRRDAFADHDDQGQVDWLASVPVDLIRGHAGLSGTKQVTVTGPDGQSSTFTANHAVAICTGSDPAVPGIDGLAGIKPWTSRKATTAAEIPRHLIIIGGGVSACEMASAYTDLGSHVTMLERGPRLLARFEPFAGEGLADSFADRGIDVRADTSAASVEQDGPATVTVRLDDGGTVSGDRLLVAAGRVPRTSDLGLDIVGLTDGKWLDVDDTCQVTAIDDGWLYAAGDVNHRAMLTHMGKYQARACGDVIARRAQCSADTPPYSRYTATADHTAVPQVVFTDPQVAMVGVTEAEAGETGRGVQVVEHPLGSIAGAALHADGYRGHAKIVVDPDRRVIIGATFLGPDVAELVHTATVAIVGEVPIDRLWHAVPSFPTLSEIWLRLLETYGL